MKKVKISNTAFVRLCDENQPLAGEYLRETPLYQLVYQDNGIIVQ